MATTPRKTFPELQALSAPVVDSDVLAVYRSPGPAKRTTASVVADYIKAFFSASGGSALVGFLQSGTGAASRTVQARLRDQINIKDFGAVLDNTTDCAAAINAAATAARAAGKTLYAPPGTGAYIASAVDLTGLLGIDFSSCPILYNAAIVGPAVEIGGFANTGQVGFAWMAEVRNSTSVYSAPPTHPSLQFIGCMGWDIKYGTANHVRFYADSTRGVDYRACAYNQVLQTGVIGRLTITDAGNVGQSDYCNSNHFRGGRLLRCLIQGVEYEHNQNLFWTTIEGAETDFEFIKTYSNHFYCERFETVGASPGVTFGSETFGNSMTFNTSQTGNTRDMFRNVMPVNEQINGNYVGPEAISVFDKVHLFEVGGSVGLLGNATGASSPNPRVAATGFSPLSGEAILTPGLGGFRFPANKAIAATEPIPVAVGDAICFEGDYDGSLIRPLVQVLGENQEILTSEGVGGAYVSMISGTFSSGTYTTSADLSATSLAPVVIVRSEVKFVRVAAYSGAGGWARSVAAWMPLPPLGRETTSAAAAIKAGIITLPGPATTGFAPVNTTIFNRTNKRMEWVSFAFELTVNGALAAGATTLTVAAIGFVGNGDIYSVMLDNGDTLTGVVAGTSGNTFTISAVPVGRSIENGARVAVCRWTF